MLSNSIDESGYRKFSEQRTAYQSKFGPDTVVFEDHKRRKISADELANYLKTESRAYDISIYRKQSKHLKKRIQAWKSRFSIYNYILLTLNLALVITWFIALRSSNDTSCNNNLHEFRKIFGLTIGKCLLIGLNIIALRRYSIKMTMITSLSVLGLVVYKCFIDGNIVTEGLTAVNYCWNLGFSLSNNLYFVYASLCLSTGLILVATDGYYCHLLFKRQKLKQKHQIGQRDMKAIDLGI